MVKWSLDYAVVLLAGALHIIRLYPYLLIIRSPRPWFFKDFYWIPDRAERRFLSLHQIYKIF